VTASEFFNRHMQAWLPRFLADLKTAPSANFYAALADLATLFFEGESQRLTAV
jgi:TorA maturation chaperone TorD